MLGERYVAPVETRTKLLRERQSTIANDSNNYGTRGDVFARVDLKSSRVFLASRPPTRIPTIGFRRKVRHERFLIDRCDWNYQSSRKRQHEGLFFYEGWTWHQWTSWYSFFHFRRIFRATFDFSKVFFSRVFENVELFLWVSLRFTSVD